MSTVTAVAAVLIDFNGTLSDDEPILYEVYSDMFAERGRSLSAQEYFERLAGHTDDEIFREIAGSLDEVDRLTRERVDRYRHAVDDGETIGPAAREAVRYAAERVPVLVVTSAWREEVEPALRAAGLGGTVRAVLAADDVARLKPHPEPYLAACARAGVTPAEALALEDTPTGIAAAVGAGVRVLAVRGTAPPESLAGAELVVDGLAVDVLAPFLG